MIHKKIINILDKTSTNLFNGELQAKKLHKALNGLRTDFTSIIDILGSLNHCQLPTFLHYYKSFSGKHLSMVFQDELGGDFEKICQEIILEKKDLIIRRIEQYLLEFPYPREDFLIALLSERTNKEIQEIKDVYLKKFGITLEEAFETYLHPIGCKYIKIWLNSLREDDTELTSMQVHFDAQMLLNLGIGTQYNGSDPVLISLLKKRSFNHLRLVFLEYYRLSGGHNLWDSIEEHMQKEHKRQLILIMEAIYNPELYAAKILFKSSENSERFCDTLVAIRLSRSKKFFKVVEHIYTENNQVKLTEEIRTHSSSSVLGLLHKLIIF